MEQKAQQLLNSFPEEKRILAEKVREILLQSSKKLSETIKWRQLTYVSGKTNIAFIYTYKTTAYINCQRKRYSSCSNKKMGNTGLRNQRFQTKVIKNIIK